MKRPWTMPDRKVPEGTPPVHNEHTPPRPASNKATPSTEVLHSIRERDDDITEWLLIEFADGTSTVATIQLSLHDPWEWHAHDWMPWPRGKDESEILAAINDHYRTRAIEHPRRRPR